MEKYKFFLKIIIGNYNYKLQLEMGIKNKHPTVYNRYCTVGANTN